MISFERVTHAVRAATKDRLRIQNRVHVLLEIKVPKFKVHGSLANMETRLPVARGVSFKI